MLHADGQGLPYYAFLHVWRAVGDGEAALRIPSVLAALVAIGATYALGARLFGRWVAVIGAALLAADPLFVFLAREARFYSFAIAFATLSMLAFVAANAGNDRPRAWVAYACAAIAAAYGHLFAVLVVAAQVTYAVANPRRIAVRPFAIALLAFVLAVAPLVWIALHGDLHHLDWIAPTTLDGIFRVIVLLTGSPELAAIEGILLAAAALAARGARTDGDRLLWCWLLVPPAIVIAFSFLHPMLVERYLSLILPALCLLAARGISTIAWVPAKAATAALVVALAAAGAVGSYAPLEDWRGAVTSVLDRAHAGDALVVFPADRAIPVTQYLQRGSTSKPALVYPAGMPFESIDFGAVAARYPRLWLVVHMPAYEDDPELDETILSAERSIAVSYSPVGRERFRRVTVVLWSHR